MFSAALRPLRRLVQVFLAHDASNQLALGFALGMLLGLLPKGNLIALSLFVLLFSLRVNRGVALLAAMAFAWIGPALDPFADRLGAYLLSASTLQPTYASLYRLPLAPWSDFNNTVVLGSLAIGLWAMYPAYWLSFRAFEWNRLRRHEAAATRFRVIDPFDVDEPVDRRAA
jgi:uncharacterized protein (TIGR03546 family)